MHHYLSVKPSCLGHCSDPRTRVCRKPKLTSNPVTVSVKFAVQLRPDPFERFTLPAVVHPRKSENHMNLSILAQVGVLVQVKDEKYQQELELVKVFCLFFMFANSLESGMAKDELVEVSIANITPTT